MLFTGGILLVFLITATIAGVLLGLRFEVFTLIAATLLAAGVIIVTGGGIEGRRTYLVWNRCVASDWVLRRVGCWNLCSSRRHERRRATQPPKSGPATLRCLGAAIRVTRVRRHFCRLVYGRRPTMDIWPADDGHLAT